MIYQSYTLSLDGTQYGSTYVHFDMGMISQFDTNDKQIQSLQSLLTIPYMVRVCQLEVAIVGLANIRLIGVTNVRYMGVANVHLANDIKSTSEPSSCISAR